VFLVIKRVYVEERREGSAEREYPARGVALRPDSKAVIS
jgi:hypothetical protein